MNNMRRNAGEKMGYEYHFCSCITQNQTRQELHKHRCVSRGSICNMLRVSTEEQKWEFQLFFLF